MGSGRGRLISAEDKQEVIHLVKEAQRAGCRIKPACEALGLDIRTLQRWLKEVDLQDKRHGPLTAPAHALTPAEQAALLEICHSKEYCNQTPSQIIPQLADKGVFIASESTLYRLLKKAQLLQHRSASRARNHHKPRELTATKPNMLWSWDISYLMSTIRGKYFYLYLFLDIFSRKIVGYNVFEEESCENAAIVVNHAYQAEELTAGEVTLHSDNGGPMKGSLMLATLQSLGIMPSFSRPSVSDDNPYSESLFKTVKYCPQYPHKPFTSLFEAKEWVSSFVEWYNHVHQHSGIQFVTPHSRHHGLDKQILEKRIAVYELARQRNPRRWSNKIRNWQYIDEVFLNKKGSQKVA